MGESKRRMREVVLAAEAAAGAPQVVDTLGGRMHVRWDEAAAATPHGQLVFFAEFLAATGVFDRWGCLLRYISDRIAPIIGTPRPPAGLPAAG